MHVKVAGKQLVHVCQIDLQHRATYHCQHHTMVPEWGEGRVAPSLLQANPTPDLKNSIVNI